MSTEANIFPEFDGTNISLSQHDAALSLVNEPTSLRRKPDFLMDLSKAAMNSCLISAFATVANAIKGYRILGNGLLDGGKIGVGELVATLIDQGETYTKEQNMLHSAVLSAAEGLGLRARALKNTSDSNSLRSFIESGGRVIISVDNRFILEQTYPRLVWYRVKHPPMPPTQPGRHALAIIGIHQPTGKFITADPFSPVEFGGKTESFLLLSPDVLNLYLQYEKPRGIAFASSENEEILEAIPPLMINSNVVANGEMTQAVSNLLPNLRY